MPSAIPQPWASGDLEGRLSCVMAFGSDAWDLLFGVPKPKELKDMNNLHRELAPISNGAWAQIEEEYLSHSETVVRLYFQETFTFLLLTAEAAMVLAPSEK